MQFTYLILLFALGTAIAAPAPQSSQVAANSKVSSVQQPQVSKSKAHHSTKVHHSTTHHHHHHHSTKHAHGTSTAHQTAKSTATPKPTTTHRPQTKSVGARPTAN